jgi:hypothetical protein
MNLEERGRGRERERCLAMVILPMRKRKYCIPYCTGRDGRNAPSSSPRATSSLAIETIVDMDKAEQTMDLPY